MNSINIKLYDFAKQEDIKANTSEYKSLWKDDFHTLDKRIMESKNDMYKAMFITGIVQLLAILGGVKIIVKYMIGK